MILYTIGHSNHPIERFISLQKAYEIAILVDIRSVPHSRFHPQFNKEGLSKVLSEQGIKYLYEGAALGGRPTDPTCYIHNAIPKSSKDYINELNYAEVMQRPWFHQGIARLLELAERQTTCILCSEADPAYCHRHHLIARYLMQEHPQVAIFHILRDGNLINASNIRSPGDDIKAEQLSF